MTTKFEVEFLRTSYVTYVVEADSIEQAEEAAWKEIPQPEFKNAEWLVASVTQVEEK